MSKFQIISRWSTTVKFECNLSAEFDSQSNGARLGAAVKLAIKADANLRDADLSGAKGAP